MPFRIEHQYVDPTKKMTQFEYMNEVLKSESLRAFNFDGIEGMSVDAFDESVRSKYMPSNTPFLLRMSPIQRSWFRANPMIMCLDGTHNSNQSNYPLITGMVYSPSGQGLPIFQCTAGAENTEAYVKCFETLKALEPESWAKFETIMSDMAPAPRAAYKVVEGKPINTWVSCYWHFNELMKTHYPKDKVIRNAIKQLVFQPSKEQFEINLAIYERDHAEDDYFTRNYGSSGIIAKPCHWARCYTAGFPLTNMHIERYHREEKKWVPRPSTIPRQMSLLALLDMRYAKREHNLELGIRGVKRSNAFTNFHGMHPQPHEQFNYVWENEQLHVTEKEDTFIMEKNNCGGCVGAACQLICLSCKKDSNETLCAHAYRCTCSQYMHTNMCRHQHFLTEDVLSGACGDNLNDTVESLVESMVLEDLDQELVHTLGPVHGLSGPRKKQKTSAFGERKRNAIDRTSRTLQEKEHQIKLLTEQVRQTEHRMRLLHLADDDIGGNRLVNETNNDFEKEKRFAGGLPKLSTRRTHTPQRRGFIPKKVRTHAVSEEPPMKDHVIQTGIDNAPTSINWGFIVCGERKRYQQLFANVDKADQESFKKKFDDARKIWSCSICTKFALTDYKSGYIRCTKCKVWSHMSCAKVCDDDEDLDYLCPACSPIEAASLID